MGKRNLKRHKVDDELSPFRQCNSMANCKRSVGGSTRKQLRKQARLLKKERKQTYFRKETSNSNEKDGKSTVRTSVKNVELKNKSGKKPSEPIQPNKKQAEENLKKIQAKQRRRLLKEDNQLEEKNIKMLEKRLKMNKRKSKSLPKVFTADGLDYILDACNSESLRQNPDLDDCDSNFNEDFAIATGQESMEVTDELNVGKEYKPKTKVMSKPNVESETESESIDEDEVAMKSSGEDESESNEEDESDSNGEDEVTDSEQSDDIDGDTKCLPEAPSTQSFREDIYGRIINSEGKIEDSKHYIPPSLRRNEAESNDSTVLRLNRQLKGLLNRLSESNMAAIVNETEGLYMQHSRNNMNSSLIKLILEAIVQIISTPERLVQEHCMLITILHANIGPEVGARMIEVLATKFNDLFEQKGTYGEGKQCDNLLLVMVHLYTFKVIHSVLVYDVLEMLISCFNEKCIELILLILRTAGFSLRKDDPVRLKNVIIKIQNQAKGTEARQDESRVKFMLDTLMAIRNNNMHKIPNYDVSHREHLRKILRSFIRKGNSVSELKITMTDLLDVNSKGRWWIVGSAWKGKSDNDKEPANVLPIVGEQEPVSGKILDLALKLHINTDIRKNIFSIIMTAEDYVDAFEKILKLSLKNAQEKESIHVALECCLQEKAYNPYYGYLLQKFCNFDRKYQMMVQFSVWDKLKELHSASSLHVSNLSHLLCHLIITKALAISVLKIIQFSEINKPTVRFLRQTLIKLLLHEPQKDMEEMFSRVAGLPKLHMFREGIRLFMRHFMLKNKDKLPSEMNENLELRIEIAEAALQSSDSTTRF